MGGADTHVLVTKEEIRGAYAGTEVAEEYIDRRFTSAWGSVLHETQVSAINRVIRAHGVKRLLEIAPGPARLSCEVVGFGQGYLCDANESMLRLAQRRLAKAWACKDGEPATGAWRAIQGDAFDLPFRGPFDMVYTFRFIRHFVATDRAALYAQIRSLLKDGGLLVFDAVNASVALPQRMKDPASHRIFDELYRRDAIVHELNVHGFDVVSLTGVMRHFTLQHWVQVLIGPRSYSLAKRLIRLLEYVPGAPLEWILVCQKN